MSENVSIFKEFILFIKNRKAWWIAPIIILLLIVGLVIILGQSSTLSPFIYSLF